ncbi:MAG: cytochrome b N-terminal domain-containing protein [Candidatus Omnitrophota bacterium]|nr:cytochrome b N-terminal domain-containing protein [Candidatus Omnitrophota bacterium]
MILLSQKIYNWFDERYRISAVRDFLSKKTVPLHRHFVWYYFGGVTLFLFIVQVVTGILLLFYYKPTASEAYESVKFIMTKVEFGWLIRSIHSWSANLMVFSAFVHLFSTFFMKSYRPPREVTWVTGAFMFFIVMGMGFTGYLLPWNELSFFATKVGTQIAGAVPVLGSYLKVMLRGGQEISDATITRFFALHVMVLPIVAAAFLGLHLTMIQLQGTSEPLSQISNPDKDSIKFFPNFILRDIIVWLLILVALLALSVMFPWELGKKADPFVSTPPGIKPEWYFVWMFQTLKIIPARILFFDGEVFGILGFGLAGFALVMIPFIDIWSRKEKRNPILAILGVCAILYILLMTYLAYFGPQK